MDNLVEAMIGVRTAGLDTDQLSDVGQQVVASLTSLLDQVAPLLEADPHALRITAEVLRSYADVVEEYARASTA
jgi:hypothetical protein